jgi:hypothetical protein
MRLLMAASICGTNGPTERCGPSHRNRSRASGSTISSKRALMASNPVTSDVMMPCGGTGVLMGTWVMLKDSTTAVAYS